MAGRTNGYSSNEGTFARSNRTSMTYWRERGMSQGHRKHVVHHGEAAITESRLHRRWYPDAALNTPQRVLPSGDMRKLLVRGEMDRQPRPSSMEAMIRRSRPGTESHTMSTSIWYLAPEGPRTWSQPWLPNFDDSSAYERRRHWPRCARRTKRASSSFMG